VPSTPTTIRPRVVSMSGQTFSLDRCSLTSSGAYQWDSEACCYVPPPGCRCHYGLPGQNRQNLDSSLPGRPGRSSPMPG
jgi:hypothetical protein